MQPQAWPSWIPSRKCYWGWKTVRSTFHPTLHKAVQYLSGQCPLRQHSAPHTCPPSGTMANPLLTSVRTPSPRTTQSPGSWQILCLSSWVRWTSPARLPTAHSALQYSTTFKQEPHCPPVNHLAHPPHPNTMDWWQSHLLHLKHPFHSNCIFHPSCSHTLTGHPCP